MIKILLSSIISVGLILGSMNIPAKWMSSDYWFHRDTFGLTYTTLTGTEQLSNFPTLWNATLSTIDTSVMELSDWFATTSAPQITSMTGLVTVGTLTSGSLGAGFTTVVVARGGTGLMTFGGANHILYTTAADTLASEAAFVYNQALDRLTVVNASTTNLSVSSLSAGRIPYVDSVNDMLLDTSNFVWDNTNVRLGIGSSTPVRSLVASSTASVECNLVDGATITFNLRFCNQGRVVLGGNRALDFTNEAEALGQSIRVVVCQDATGSRTLTHDSAIRWAGGSAPTLTTTASKCDVLAGFTTIATGTPIILLDKILNF